MALAAWAALCFAIALAGTWLARRYALHAALLDHPGERRAHVAPTPRGGGIAIVAAVLPVLGALCIRDAQARALFAPATLGLLPKSLAQHHEEAGALRILPLTLGGIMGSVCMTWLRAGEEAPAQMLLRTCLDEAAKGIQAD